MRGPFACGALFASNTGATLPKKSKQGYQEFPDVPREKDPGLTTDTPLLFFVDTLKSLDRGHIYFYNSLRFAEVVELVDTSVSKTDGFWPCRFDSGLRHHSKSGPGVLLLAFCISEIDPFKKETHR